MIYETIAEDILRNPSRYTIMEVVLASGIIQRRKEREALESRYNQVVDRLLDAEIRYERSFQES